jgi:hypothetical protein
MRWGFVVLWVVIGIIIIERLVWMSLPRRDWVNALSTAATFHASGVHKACMLYAHDHEGLFPTGDGSAAEAFRKLFPEFLQDEKLFFVPGSAWHDEAPLRKPDGEIGSSPDFARCLERGENHWAYVTGLSESSDPNVPLIADGFVEGKPGQYTDDPKKKGGVWKGTKAVVVYVSGAAKAEPLSIKTGFRVKKPMPTANDVTRKVDIFAHDGGLPSEARVLNPW